MPVSDKMINACNAEADEFLGQLDNPYEVAQATVNAAWHKFKTFKGLDLDKHYLWEVFNTDNAFTYLFVAVPRTAQALDRNIIHYADPQDLMKSGLLYIQADTENG